MPSSKNEKAILALADGTVVHGIAIGHKGTAGGELCFNTSMTGYQEIFTDPSYHGQLMMMTYPHIGNYGVSARDDEAHKVMISGLIVRAFSYHYSNLMADGNLNDYLKRNKVIGITGIDTRKLVRHIREKGVINAIISSDNNDAKDLVKQARQWPSMVGLELASKVTLEDPRTYKPGELEWNHPSISQLASHTDGQASARKFTTHTATSRAAEAATAGVPSTVSSRSGKNQPVEHEGKQNGGIKENEEQGKSGKDERRALYKVAALDYGIKQNIINNLVQRGCMLRLFPAKTDFETIMKWEPDAFFFSNGPGDPNPMVYAIDTITKAKESGKPIFGICLGHQLLALSEGMQVTKMFVGHRGANQPVKNLHHDHVEITTQNHGFAIDSDSVSPDIAEVTHRNLNDGTLEGLNFKRFNGFSVQYHPEASPGPHDSSYLFDEFINRIKTHKAQKGLS
ncbi:MAG: carbamoyl phosphate synthase small subunit [Balneolales bacterium]